MKIAVIAPQVTPIAEPQLGGSQAILADIAAGLTSRGHDVTVFAASGSRIDGVHVVETGVDPAALRGTLFRPDGQPDGQPDASAASDAFADVYRLVGEERFDVVHNHAFDVPAIALAPDDVPVVHTLHLPPQRDIAQAVATARERGRVTACAVSRFAAASWHEHVGIDVVLRNGVPVDRIPFAAHATGGALFAGRLSPEKGVVEAVAIARAAGERIVVVGDPYDERYAADHVAPLAGPDVMLLPAVPRAELWRLMGNACAVLCPARWDEPFGLVAAEAQACGTPVVAFARGALGEVVRDGSTGALVTDVDEAADALSGAGAYDRAMCRSHAQANLDIAHTLDAHEQLYARLVRTPTGTA